MNLLDKRHIAIPITESIDIVVGAKVLVSDKEFFGVYSVLLTRKYSNDDLVEILIDVDNLPYWVLVKDCKFIGIKL